MLKRTSRFLSMRTRKLLFNAMVLPHLGYCSVVLQQRVPNESRESAQ